jgi:serine phosphatase RsbU (regulator of sigma subunit)/anti-sigma regulatory factor (Ser/Thr protein kinase)/anti-anti-sigma regulatory factor
LGPPGDGVEAEAHAQPVGKCPWSTGFPPVTWVGRGYKLRSHVVIGPAAGDALSRRSADPQAEAEAHRLAAAADVRPDPAGEVTARLQQALLPSAVPVLPQARIAARYLVASQEQAGGGDWLDAIPLAAGTVALVVGDVVGHGLAAAAAMAQLRAVLTELMIAEADLGAVLARLDAFAERTQALRAATLALAVVDPAVGSVQYVTCGHPAPLIVAPDGATRFLAASGSGPLGVGSVPVLAADQLLPGEVIVLYSDGLIEQPGTILTEGMTLLAAVAADAAAEGDLAPGPPGRLAERVCQLATERLAGAASADDVTVLAAERRAVAIPPLRLRVQSEAASLTVLRRALHGWLGDVDPQPDDRDAIHMAVVEIATNAIEHAYPAGEPGPVDFSLALRSDGQLECVVADYGRWQVPGQADADRGNGLMVTRHLVDEMRISHPAEAADAAAGAPSTVVTLLHLLRRPVALGVAGGPEPATAASPPPFDVTNDTAGKTARALVRGPVDITTADQLLRRLLAACRGGTLPLTVDLTGVTQLASAGVSALYQLSRQLTLHQHSLSLVVTPGSAVDAVLELVRLPRIASLT